MHPLTVLVVEDEFLLRMELADELRRAGFEVVEAERGDEAQAMMGSTEVDIVCTDVRMPGPIDGITLTQWIKAHRPEVPVLIVSGNLASTDCSTGADAVFTKPVSYERFLRRIEEIAGGLELQRMKRPLI